jgi:hypothetical protein
VNFGKTNNRVKEKETNKTRLKPHSVDGHFLFTTHSNTVKRRVHKLMALTEVVPLRTLIEDVGDDTIKFRAKVIVDLLIRESTFI